MTKPAPLRCAIYTRKSSEEGLDQSFNSLDAQREACAAYIKSQSHEGWRPVDTLYDDGGYSGGSMDRPGLQRLLADIDRRMIDIVVVYKVDRLTRSLIDFARIVEVLNSKKVSFVSVTQQFNTTSSMGRLTLNVLLSFAQFEREVTGERIRDKIAASKKKGMWMGGYPPLGYDILNRKLAVVEAEAKLVRDIFALYLRLGSVHALAIELRRRSIVGKRWKTRAGKEQGGNAFGRGALYHLLRSRIYIGEVRHKDRSYPGEHKAIVERGLWNAVQAKLDDHAGNRSAARRTRARHRLTGLFYDDRGNRMSPSHVKKKDGRRYRYYLSQALLQGQPDEAGSLPRIPAQPIEDLILDRAHRLGRPNDTVANDTSLPEADIDLIRARFSRIVLGKDEVRITLGAETKIGPEVRRRLPDTDQIEATEAATDIAIPVRLKTYGGEKVIEGPNGTSPYEAVNQDRPLVHALILAHRWRKALEDGEAASLEALARASNTTEAYVRYVLELAFLAPDIAESILAGRQRRPITVDRLLRMKLPLSWTVQRRTLGLPA